MPERNIKWGIIGCGDVTEVKSGPAFSIVAGSKLHAVMRRNPDLAEDYAQRHNVPRWYSNAEALINDPEVNAVYVATPPSSHKHYTLMAAAAGKPVYCEKPMSVSYRDCQEMIEGCRKADVPLYVAYYRRALPKFFKIKEMLNSGIIGNIRTVTVRFLRRPSSIDLDGKANWRTDPSISGGGYFIDLASHQIDILQFFLGGISVVKGLTANLAKLYAAEDTVSAVFRFENGVTGAGIWSFSSSGDCDITEITGDKGTLCYATFGNSPILINKKYDIEEVMIPNPVNIQLPMITIITEQIRKDPGFSGNYESAASVNKLIDSIYGLN